MDPTFSPPEIEPTDPDEMYYSSPENEENLLPVLVHLKDDAGNAIADNVVITATTILGSLWNSTSPLNDSDDTYAGRLCERSKRHHSYFPPPYFTAERIICNNNTGFPKGDVQNTTYDGVARFERLLNTQRTDAVRRLYFVAEYNNTILTTFSHPFTVYPSGAKLEMVSPSQIPDTYVNHPMTIVVQTMMADDPVSPTSYSALTIGRHSVLTVDLTVSWDRKHFAALFKPGYVYHFHSLISTEVILGGSDVSENAKEDLRIRKRCINGSATFEDVRILTEATDVHLNITQSQPHYPWTRVPFEYNDVLVMDGIANVLNLSYSQNGGVFVTNGFNVSGKLIHLKRPTHGISHSVFCN